MGVAIARYRMGRDDVVAVRAALDRAGILNGVFAEFDGDVVELETTMGVEGPAHQPELDELRSKVESVLLTCGVPLDIASYGVDGGLRATRIEPE